MPQSDSVDEGQAFQSAERADAFRRQVEAGRARSKPSTDLMLSWANLRPGARVLDIAAGTGEQTIQAARLVAPGEVIATDISANMLAIAADAARDAKLSNVSTRVMDARSLDFPDESFDAAICRLGLMFVPEPERAFREIRRVLRPGARLAAVVFADASRNPHSELALSVARRIGGIPDPPAGAPGMLALGSPGVFEGLFHRAGFRDIQIEPVPFNFRASSLSEAMALRRNTPTVVMLELLDRLNEQQRERYWVELEEEYRQFDGPDGFVGPGEQLVGAGAR